MYITIKYAHPENYSSYRFIKRVYNNNDNFTIIIDQMVINLVTFDEFKRVKNDENVIVNEIIIVFY